MRHRLSAKEWTLAALLLALAVLSVTPVLDQRAANHYDDLFQRALVTFALARTLNGVISAVQGTELALQPAGVGVTLTPGEILDPVNDLVERFSWIMLGATLSLGVQQVLLEISAWWLIQGLVVVLAAWLCLLWWRQPRDGSKRTYSPWLTRALLAALFLRFAVPLTLIANDALYRVFLEPRYVGSTEVITEAGRDLEDLGDPPEPLETDPTVGEDADFIERVLGSVGQAIDSASERMNLREKVRRIQTRATEIVENLIQLSVVFILQTAILPIAFLWVFLQLAKRLFRPPSD